MYRKLSNRIVVSSLLVTFLLNVCVQQALAQAASSRSRSLRGDMSPEQVYLRKLGLKEDVNDTEIIALLDVPEKQIFATAVIRYRRISSAVPKLLEIVRGKGGLRDIPAKLVAAKALCGFNNRDWIEPIRALSADPNNIFAHTAYYRISVASLLARAGDYSQFKVVAEQVRDSRSSARSSAVTALGNFGHKTDPVTNSAVELLTSVATSDPKPGTRRRAIYALEKIAKTKPEAISKLIQALEANADSEERYYTRLLYASMLKLYREQVKSD